MKQSFVGSISWIRTFAQEKNISISDADFAKALNIPIDQFKQFYETDNAPKEIFELLRTHFGEYLGGTTHIVIKSEDLELPDPEDEE